MVLKKESLEEIWQTTSVKEIARRFSVKPQKIYQLSKKWNLPEREREEDAPSEQEIAERAAQVRATWSDADWESRAVGPVRNRERWTPPTIRIGECEAPSFSRTW